MRTTRPCSDATDTTPALDAPGRGRLIVLEGMPGAGKTTIAEHLSGAGVPVLGEYTTSAGATLAHADHPGVADDDAHQANWLLKTAQAEPLLAVHPTVVADRDWLSALAYAHSIDDEELLAARVSWVVDQLRAGWLLVPALYVVFDLEPSASLDRRHDADAGHPWSRIEPLERLRRFYLAPGRAVAAFDPLLCALLRVQPMVRLSGHNARRVNVTAVRDILTGEPS
ncbi:AAA family ATPase [Streptosporangium saharense]|uniref:Putative ATPase n=1 Tax=Streptosporangium saharense TaxID=1706840 RepID=A0A7W7VSA6_9ACTN|nr:AAA family ATPase [Streptosporangium saharense]MBB4920563.1 putative ATPase [Streptosporangium saharense]